ncbi:hypothetical protein R6Q59_022160 [Mikania micrantha]
MREFFTQPRSQGPVLPCCLVKPKLHTSGIWVWTSLNISNIHQSHPSRSYDQISSVGSIERAMLPADENMIGLLGLATHTFRAAASVNRSYHCVQMDDSMLTFSKSTGHVVLCFDYEL